nr:hypothetical protein [Pelagibacterales bacterium]
ELVNVNVNPDLSFLGGNSQYLHPDYVCATYSNSLMNYMCLCAILAITFSYCNKKINLNFAESFLCVLISCAFLKHAEAFTLDRISILYFLITLYFIDKKYISIILVIFSCLVNEKIVFILCILFFIRFFLNKKKYLHLLLSSCLSGILLVLIFLFYSKFLGHGYFGHNLENGIYNTAFTMDGLYRIYSMFLSPSGYSNTVMPLVFATLPYILTFFNKIDNFYFSKIEILIPFSLLFFSLGGGMENGGRYIIYPMPLWTPIFSVHIFCFIKKLSAKI